MATAAQRRIAEPAQGSTTSTTSNTAVNTRPDLAVVARRRRWPAMIAGLAWAIVSVGLLGAAVFHTQLAERQLRLDRLDRQVAVERERFDELRYERAELRSPVRLSAAASELGMSRGSLTSYVAVHPDALARQIAAAGVFGDDIGAIVSDVDPLEQFRAVKSVTEVTP